MKRNTKDGPREEAPEGYRLLMQVFDATTAADASAQVVATFGSAKCDGMLLIPGTYRNYAGQHSWLKSDKGWMAFIPEKS